jgi:predicted DNA binding CopG/RHH family protein
MATRPKDLTARHIAEAEDKKARKDATLNMRISSHELKRIKEAALAEGYEKYQEWVHLQLTRSVKRALGKKTPADEY